jgi:TRAP-type C4-dicarboxylate transport system permease small subunit
MEFSVLVSGLQYFLLIMGGCLIFFILVLFFSDRYTRSKLNQMEQNEKMNEIQRMTR